MEGGGVFFVLVVFGGCLGFVTGFGGAFWGGREGEGRKVFLVFFIFEILRFEVQGFAFFVFLWRKREFFLWEEQEAVGVGVGEGGWAGFLGGRFCFEFFGEAGGWERGSEVFVIFFCGRGEGREVRLFLDG